jgi:hypothetical protein
MTNHIERRRGRRSSGAELPEDLSGRIRPGHQVRVLDLSAWGALVETSRRLLPGSIVDLQLEAEDWRQVTKARVVRCSVGQVRADALVFRGALSLEPPISWPTERVSRARAGARG